MIELSDKLAAPFTSGPTAPALESGSVRLAPQRFPQEEYTIKRTPFKESVFQLNTILSLFKFKFFISKKNQTGIYHIRIIENTPVL